MSGSYKPLYRKYRPQTFKDLVGQEAISKTLSNAIELNKVAHAYLFTGPRGTGKTSTARIFAKSLNCEKGPTIDPCGVCSSCIDIANGNSIDVIEIDAASNRKVEDARNLLEKVQFVPVAGKFKVYIIDEVHMLTTEAFNTLLKTLEEPPQNLVFILATTEAHKVLNTIISRCQRFDFRRIKQDLITQRLKEISKLENLNISDQALSLIARKASGGMRDALGLLDQAGVLASVQNKVEEKDILLLLGSLQEDTLYRIADAVANRDTKSLISILDETVQLGSEPVQIIRELMGYFRNLMLVSTTDNIDQMKTLIDVSEPFYEKLKSQSKKFEVIEITQIIEKLSNAEKTLKTTTQQHLWLEVSLISICHRHDIQLVKDLEDRISKLEEAFSGGNVNISAPVKPQVKLELPKPEIQRQPVKPEPAHETKQDTVPQPVKQEIMQEVKAKPVEEMKTQEKAAEITQPVSSNSSGDISKDWAALLEGIESVPSRMFFYNLSKPVEINSEKVVITFAVETFVKQAQDPVKFKPLEKSATKLFGTTPRIIIRTSLPEDNIQNIKPAAKPSPQQAKPPAKKENFEQISQDMEEITPKKSVPVVAVAEKPANPVDEEILEEINNKKATITPVNLTDQARIALDLFQGKIIQ